VQFESASPANCEMIDVATPCHIKSPRSTASPLPDGSFRLQLKTNDRYMGDPTAALWMQRTKCCRMEFQRKTAPSRMKVEISESICDWQEQRAYKLASSNGRRRCDGSELDLPAGGPSDHFKTPMVWTMPSLHVFADTHLDWSSGGISCERGTDSKTCLGRNRVNWKTASPAGNAQGCQGSGCAFLNWEAPFQTRRAGVATASGKVHDSEEQPRPIGQ
jgi:hypothetical protein